MKSLERLMSAVESYDLITDANRFLRIRFIFGLGFEYGGVPLITLPDTRCIKPFGWLFRNQGDV